MSSPSDKHRWTWFLIAITLIDMYPQVSGRIGGRSSVNIVHGLVLADARTKVFLSSSSSVSATNKAMYSQEHMRECFDEGLWYMRSVQANQVISRSNSICFSVLYGLDRERAVVKRSSSFIFICMHFEQFVPVAFLSIFLSKQCRKPRRIFGDAKTRPRDLCICSATRVTFVTDAF